MRIDLHYFLGDKFWDKATTVSIVTLFVSVVSAGVTGLFAYYQRGINEKQVEIQTQQLFSDNNPSLYIKYDVDSKVLKLTNIGEKPVMITCVLLDEATHTNYKTGENLDSPNIPKHSKQLYDKREPLLLKSLEEKSLNNIDLSNGPGYSGRVKNQFNISFYVINPMGGKYKIPYKVETVTDDSKIVDYFTELQKPEIEGSEFSKKCESVLDSPYKFFESLK